MEMQLPEARSQKITRLTQISTVPRNVALWEEQGRAHSMGAGFEGGISSPKYQSNNYTHERGMAIIAERRVGLGRVWVSKDSFYPVVDAQIRYKVDSLTRIRDILCKEENEWTG